MLEQAEKNDDDNPKTVLETKRMKYYGRWSNWDDVPIPTKLYEVLSEHRPKLNLDDRSEDVNEGEGEVGMAAASNTSPSSPETLPPAPDALYSSSCLMNEDEPTNKRCFCQIL